jgi:hypothetical protein
MTFEGCSCFPPAYTHRMTPTTEYGVFISPAVEMEQSRLATDLHTLLEATAATPWADVELAYAGVQEVAGTSGAVFEYARGHFERFWAIRAGIKKQRTK